MVTTQEIQHQTEYADNLFEEMNRKIEALKGKLLNLSEAVNNISKKLEGMSYENAREL